jgi:CheY-like chemotaxis protein
MPTSSEPSAAPLPELDEPQGLCLLFVEDDEADAYLIGRALSDNPVVGKVVRARDGVEALAMVESGEVGPDLAFIDLHMPRMDGFDLLMAFSSRSTAGFPMVVLTSSAAPFDAVRSRLRNAIRVVTKPENVLELYSVLKTTVEAFCPPGKRTINARPGKSPAYLLVSPQTPIRRIPSVDGVIE